MIKKFSLKTVFTSIILFCFVLIAITCSDNKNIQDTNKTFSSSKKIPDVIDFNFHVKPILSDRCFKCHGPDKAKIEAGLSLSNKKDAFIALGDQKDHFAIVSGNVEKSTLIDRIKTNDPEIMMPPPESNLSLDDYEKQILTKWIEQGASWKEHWSFLKIENTIPEVSDNSNIYNPIDKFIQKKLHSSNLDFSDKATKERQIRRLAFDITGLPPSVEKIQSFLEDESPDAYEKLIDYYLNSDAYAENMSSMWMDLARYADTHGYQDDLERVMWPWRDWVIHAYKNNMPYDQFVTWQLAGDLLSNPTKEQIIATAFNRNHSITQEGGVIPEEYRVEYVADRTQTFGKAFLGLTVECARCHDHKYDPISTEDFYSLFSFFNNVPEKGLIEAYGAIPEPYITLSDEEVKTTLQFINNLDTLEEFPLMVMEEMKEPRQAYILERGAYENHGKKVFPNTPSSILPFDNFQQNRLGLAEWLFDKNNPITARVAVNRIWQNCFGQGIVKTSDDFGAQGSLPSHPELLDHLAYTFIENGWDVKFMMKYILSSYTYQQSSKLSAELLELDPENQLYARAPRLRLSAEKIRDHMLQSSGLLVHEIGGPSVKPYQPPGLWKEKVGGGGGTTAEYKQDNNNNQFRRSLYTFWKRTVPPPSMITFDAVSRDLCMVQRETTSTPLQALIMMNNPEIIEASRNLAYQAIQSSDEIENRIEYMFISATSRKPTAKELLELKKFFENEQSKFNDNQALAESFLKIGSSPQMELLPIAETAAYSMLAYTIYNLDESISRS